MLVLKKKTRLTFSSSSYATSAARGLCQLVLRMRVSRRGAPLTSSILAFPWWQMSKVTVCWVSSQVALTVKQFCIIYLQINNFPYLQKSLKNHPFTIFIYYSTKLFNSAKKCTNLIIWFLKKNCKDRIAYQISTIDAYIQARVLQ